MISFYDTMSREIRELKPLASPKVTIYTCGPTVYKHSHIGNMRSYLAVDLLRRAITTRGGQVQHITNITDVGHLTDDSAESGEDKILLSAEDEGLSPAEIAEKYTGLFMEHVAALNILPSNLYPRATDHIQEMIEIITKLIERGHAYEVDGFVYFDVDSFKQYGRLSRNTLQHLKQSARTIAVDTSKKNSYDFTLWRAAQGRRLMKWNSPWGEGFPGWHIECSAMSIKHLGDRFDVHTGGSDNIFPHHEAEIAQSEAYLGHEVVGQWLHGHHLLANSRKMAKSAKNYFIVDDILERGYDPLAFRYLLLQTRYRAQTNFTWEALDSAAKGLERLRRKVASWGPPQEVSSQSALAARDNFESAIANDLDTPRALKVLSSIAGSSDAMSDGERRALVSQWDEVLGLDLVVPMQDLPLPEGASDLLEQREKARAASDFATSDRLRDSLAELGVRVTDTSEGQRWGAGSRLPM